MSDCASVYTIDRRTGEKLVCSGQHLRGNPFIGEIVHTAQYSGLTWTWYSSEEDKNGN